MTMDYSRFGRRRPVIGGVSAHTARGPFGKTWWGAAVVESVESMAERGRLSRGRTYARAGQVVSLTISAGAVVADVQGSQPDPFRSEFTVRPLAADARAELVDAVRGTPGMLAAIVSGELPRELGPHLLPQSASDLDFTCSCPDPGWPCKHVAAVVYLFAEQVDADPLQLLTLRGVVLDELIGAVESGCAPAPDDPYGDRSALPPLPRPEFRPAPEDLDPAPWRKVLRSLDPEPAAVRAAERELAALYERLR